MSSDRQIVAIIGAGLTGLLAAHGLKKNGFDVVVFEREASLDARARDWTMLVHWAMPIFAKLIPEDIIADLPTAYCNPHQNFNDAEVETLPCYNGVTGEILFKSPTPGARRVSRQGLRKLLAQYVDIKWNTTLVGISTSQSDARLEFEDGRTFDAHYVLGTDGASSKVRELLLGVEEAQLQLSGHLFATGVTRFNDVAKTDAIVQTHPVAALMMGTGSVGAVGVMSVDDPNDKSTWTTFWARIWRGKPVDFRNKQALDYIRENTSPLRGIFQSAIDWTPDDARVNIDEMKYWNPVRWNNRDGRVTLAGDAAHPMLIYRGQGFQHSIIDVQNYADALVRVRGHAATRREIIAAYDSEVIERGGTAVKQSLQEAEKSFDVELVAKMLMATRGHTKAS